MKEHTVTVEEIRHKDVTVKAQDWQDAFAEAERAYLDGDIDMRTPDVARVASLGSGEHEFFEIFNY